MNTKNYDEIQTALYQIKSIILLAMSVQDVTHDEIEGALWAAHDLIGKAESLLKDTDTQRLNQP